MEQKMTKVQALEMAVEVLQGVEGMSEVVDVLQKEAVRLAGRKSGPSAKVLAEREAEMQAVVEVLEAKGEAMKAGEVAVELAWSVPKASARLKALVEAKRVAKRVEGKASLFELAEAE